MSVGILLTVVTVFVIFLFAMMIGNKFFQYLQRKQDEEANNKYIDS
ncbi:hypothetical protein ACJ2A9_01675 [Anaerobacillus sp. MEB173]